MRFLLVLLLVACAAETATTVPVHNEAPKPLRPRFAPRLEGEARVKFDTLAGEIASPCGRAHSLMTSLETDPACTRTPHALRYLERLIKAGLPTDEVHRVFDDRYPRTPRSVQPFQLSRTPVTGDANAKVKLVEFVDYECPHCAALAPIIDELQDKFGKRIAIFHKNYPLPRHAHAREAAVAALAANRQGKFLAMNDMIFENQQALTTSDLASYAKQLGLDMAQYQQDLLNPDLAQQVEADLKEAENANLDHTPGVYINGRYFGGTLDRETLADAIEEELELP